MIHTQIPAIIFVLLSVSATITQTLTTPPTPVSSPAPLNQITMLTHMYVYSTVPLLIISLILSEEYVSPAALIQLKTSTATPALAVASSTAQKVHGATTLLTSVYLPVPPVLLQTIRLDCVLQPALFQKIHTPILSFMFVHRPALMVTSEVKSTKPVFVCAIITTTEIQPLLFVPFSVQSKFILTGKM